MDIRLVVESFAALAQETRLAAFQLLVHAEPVGLAAGVVAQQLEVPHNTMSSHLKVLARAGWVGSERQGRSIVYRARLAHMTRMIDFLARDCCAGHSEVCAPLAGLVGPGRGK